MCGTSCILDLWLLLYFVKQRLGDVDCLQGAVFKMTLWRHMVATRFRIVVLMALRKIRAMDSKVSSSKLINLFIFTDEGCDFCPSFKGGWSISVKIWCFGF